VTAQHLMRRIDQLQVGGVKRQAFLE